MEKGSMSTSTGSVYQRADGYWIASVIVAGKKIVKYGKTKQEARRRLADLLAASSTGTLAPPTRCTLAEWAGRWLDGQDIDRRPSTLRSYQQVLAPVLDRLGHVRLDRLTPLQLSTVLSDLRRSGRGSRRIQQAYVVLGTCLRQAVKLGLIGANPLDRVDKPRHEPRRKTLWTLDEARRFLHVADKSSRRYAPLFVLIVGTGLRVGEALGLRWDDIDLVRRTVTVRQAYVYAGNIGSIQPPKTRSGHRVVLLPDGVVDTLLRLPRPIDPATNVFATANGTPPMQSNLRRDLHHLCETASVPTIAIHDIRHVHAALLAAEGVDPHTLRKRLGHSRVSTTLDIYAYAIAPDETAVSAFERATRPPADPTADQPHVRRQLPAVRR
jgi:integrase